MVVAAEVLPVDRWVVAAKSWWETERLLRCLLRNANWRSLPDWTDHASRLFPMHLQGVTKTLAESDAARDVSSGIIRSGIDSRCSREWRRLLSDGLNHTRWRLLTRRGSLWWRVFQVYDDQFCAGNNSARSRLRSPRQNSPPTRRSIYRKHGP
jgi:hypothetical protein